MQKKWRAAANFSLFTIHFSLKISTFAACMNKGHKETISIRFISTAFMILAIAIFKPFGLEAGQWQAYLHLLSLFALGLFSCFITEVILRYVVRMPRSYERGVSYIINRNLRFQFINTPLVAEQLSGDAGHHRLPIFRHRTLLAIQVPKQVSGNGTGRDKAAERRTEEDARA